MYHYWGFGLNIASELEFPELLQLDFEGQPDLTVHIGNTPTALMGAGVDHKPCISLNQTQYLLRLADVANYYAVNGNNIVIEPSTTGDSRSLRLFFLDAVMAAVLHQRNTIMLDASAVVVNGCVIMICGASNCGKSTLAMKMHGKGYQLFSDELCIIQSSENKEIKAVASYPAFKLWQNSFDKIGIPVPGESYKVRADLGKYNVFCHEHFSTKAMAIKQVYILNKSSQKLPVSIHKLSPTEAFAQLHHNIYCLPLFYSMKKQQHYFPVMSNIANTTPVFSINRYEDENTIEEICQLLETNF